MKRNKNENAKEKRHRAKTIRRGLKKMRDKEGEEMTTWKETSDEGTQTGETRQGPQGSLLSGSNSGPECAMQTLHSSYIYMYT